MSKKNHNQCTLYMDKEVTCHTKMKLLLQGFSHKNSVDGHISRGTSHIEIRLDDNIFDIYLAVEIDDREGEKRFDSLYSHGYEFHLNDFDYDRSIVIEVYKSDDERFRNQLNDTYFTKKE